jgi:Ca2+-binding RTX toxin-like protein
MTNSKIDSLENRTLFSSAIVVGSDVPNSQAVVNRILQIEGTSKNDLFVVTRDAAGTAVPAKATLAEILAPDGSVENILVNGTTKNTVKLPGNQSFIHIHSKRGEFYFASGGISGISINGAAGDDEILVATDVRLPTTLIGGDGNDTLEGSTKSDSISGGDGNDEIIGGKVGTAGNTLIGGNGADTIFGASPDDSIVNPPDGFRDEITELTTNIQLTEQSQHFNSEDSVRLVQFDDVIPS